MTDARRDEKLEILVSRHGLKAYARYFLILEVIAEQMDEKDRVQVTYSNQYWAKVLRCKARDVSLVLRSFDALALLEASTNDELTTVKCEKLLQIRARKNPIGGKTRTPEVEVEVEVEVEEEIVSARPTKKRKSSPQKEPDLFAEFYANYPKKRHRKEALKAWQNKNPNEATAKRMIEDVTERKESDPQWTKNEGNYVPNPSRYINQDLETDDWKKVDVANGDDTGAKFLKLIAEQERKKRDAKT